MSKRLLGETFDIHGGGLDLKFPHHENEIAQSECCHGKPMAKYWLHNGLLRAGTAGKLGGRNDRDDNSVETPEQAEAGKMSRSKGAGGLRGLIERQGGERLRFLPIANPLSQHGRFQRRGGCRRGQITGQVLPILRPLRTHHR